MALLEADSTGTTSYTWDFENRLARVTLPGGSQVNFKYDPKGRNAPGGGLLVEMRLPAAASAVK